MQYETSTNPKIGMDYRDHGCTERWLNTTSLGISLFIAYARQEESCVLNGMRKQCPTALDDQLIGNTP
jgi:hypothetical protein